jgi:hypothetical protein
MSDRSQLGRLQQRIHLRAQLPAVDFRTEAPCMRGEFGRIEGDAFGCIERGVECGRRLLVEEHTGLVLSNGLERATGAVRDHRSTGSLGLDQSDAKVLDTREHETAGFAEQLRNGFRELKRHPSEAKRLPALLRGLARAHEPDAQRAAQQITHLIGRIQAPAKDKD